MSQTIATPNLLSDPGFLFWAPLGSAEPTNTVTGSVFTDTWPVAWIALGATEAGSEFNYTSTVNPISVAEILDPIAYRTTERSGNWAFNLASFTAANLKKTFNGAATTVTGSTGTTLTKIVPPTPGNEVRAMLGWESLDATVRIVAYQVLNSGDVKLTFAKAPAVATIPWTANFEVPSSGTPWAAWTAGVNRA